MEDSRTVPGTKTAFALAGGGTKGAFEAGAIQYAVEELGLRPDVITATSAGAIVGAVLAQARTKEEMRRRSAELRTDVMAMSRTDVVFGKQPWLAALEGTALGALVDEALAQRARPPVPGEAVVDGASVSRRSRIQRVAWPLARSLHRLPQAAAGLRGAANSLLTLDPLELALRQGGPTGICPIDPALIARPGMELRIAVTALGAGVLRYVTQSGQVVQSDAATLVAGAGAGPVDLVQGVLASASVPMVFPPRPLADDVYVDGGVIQNVPVQPALDLGAERVIAILAVPLGRAPVQRNFATMNMLGVFLRSSGAIAFAERQEKDVTVHLPEGAQLQLVDPLVDIVSPFEISPGLMRIDMEYGWLRAADVLDDLEPELRRQASQATTALITARTRAWHLEERLAGSGRSGGEDRRELEGLKAEVERQVARREALGVPLPPAAPHWATGPEGHQAWLLAPSSTQSDAALGRGTPVAAAVPLRASPELQS